MRRPLRELHIVLPTALLLITVDALHVAGLL